MLAQKNGSRGGTAVSSRSWSFIAASDFSFQKLAAAIINHHHAMSVPSGYSVSWFGLEYPEVLYHSSYLGSDLTGFLWAEMKENPQCVKTWVILSSPCKIVGFFFFFFGPPLNLENAVCFRYSVGSVMGQSRNISESPSVEKDKGWCCVLHCVLPKR